MYVVLLCYCMCVYCYLYSVCIVLYFCALCIMSLQQGRTALPIARRLSYKSNQISFKWFCGLFCTNLQKAMHAQKRRLLLPTTNVIPVNLLDNPTCYYKLRKRFDIMWPDTSGKDVSKQAQQKHYHLLVENCLLDREWW